ncbi:MAG: C39 family peptidase [Candidatus Eremiobacteraeota bacterium]|nr:C39 family peptidase [Candidatus Eremiobacteraeota bacterium]
MGYLERSGVTAGTTLAFEPALEGVLSWNALATSGSLSFRLRRDGTPATPWLEYAHWGPAERWSFASRADGVRVETDVIRADEPFDGVDLHGDDLDFALLAFATRPVSQPSLPYARDAFVLDVPARSQYVIESERGWCSAASLSMLHAYHGIDISVQETAAEVYDTAYRGTGNWAFNMAFSGRLGLRGVVAYLDGLDRAQRLIERSLPIAISYRGSEGELPDAPLEHSDGHFVVLCGFTSNGDCVVNDPAHPDLRAVYPRAAIERIWQRGGGVSYIVTPNGLAYADVLA